MSNPTRIRKSYSVPVIMYPEGVIVGSVRTGKNSSGRVRHVATTASGERVGTFDMYREAADHLLALARKTSPASAPEPTVHVVELVPAAADRREGYGIEYTSRYVFEARKRYSAPTRVNVWDNTSRPNPRNGEQVRFGEYGPIDGGDGRYLDPHRKATDAPVSFLLSPEASCITNNGTNTGTEASGQVYAPAGTVIRQGDVVCLVWPDGSEQRLVAHFTNNGHGYLAPQSPREWPEPQPEPETPAQRSERLAGELVADVLAVTGEHRYARAYGVLAGLIRGSISDSGAVGFAREVVRQLDAAQTRGEL